MKRWTPAGEGTPLVCAHRGASAHALENSVEAARLAAESGAAWIEFDVRPAADGLVVHHDPTTSDGQRVCDTRGVDLGEAAPSFGGFVNACGDMGLDIELKTDDIGIEIPEFVESVADEILRHKGDRTYGQMIVTSFDQQALDAFHAVRPDIATGVLFHDRPGEWAIARALQQGHVAIVPWYRLVSSDLVAQAHGANLAVLTWTVNEPGHAQSAAEAGVDMVIGDDPALLRATLSQS